jgi:hypothetical protein
VSRIRKKPERYARCVIRPSTFGVIEWRATFPITGNWSFQVPWATRTGCPPPGTELMSAMSRLALFTFRDPVGVEIQSMARSGSFGSSHRKNSCGVRMAPLACRGTHSDMNAGFAGSDTSKNRNVGVTAPGTHEWITELHANDSTISRSSRGHTRSSRVVSLTFPAWGGPISFTTVGLDGSVASTTRIPGFGWGQASRPRVSLRGSPSPHRLDPSVRFPT